MRALVKTAVGVGRVELVDLPEPACTPDGVKVEVKFTGICGTDIHVYHDRFRYYSPVILGHEFAGLVVETGAAVQGIKTGDRVAVLGSTMVQCGVCEYCTRGNYMFCPAAGVWATASAAASPSMWCSGRICATGSPRVYPTKKRLSRRLSPAPSRRWRS